jgi:hypothetical protein
MKYCQIDDLIFNSKCSIVFFSNTELALEDVNNTGQGLLGGTNYIQSS